MFQPRTPLLPQRHDLSGAFERIGYGIVVDCFASVSSYGRGSLEGEVPEGERDEVAEFAIGGKEVGSVTGVEGVGGRGVFAGGGFGGHAC